MTEFERQLQNLLDVGYASLAGLSKDEFAASAEPLRALATDSSLLVVPLNPYETVPLLTLSGKKKPGVVDRNYKPGELTQFIPVVEVPSSSAYLIFGVERGEEFCNVKPEEATATIAERGRSPLTVAEGIALVTHHPAILEKNKCFMLAGSRCGDRRVPALWISEGAPKLGWCWNGNPHTWLGTASCGVRQGL